MDFIKILVVDDHPMMREAIITALDEETDMKVIGEATNGIEGIKLAEELQPDVILMDLLMPDMDGLEAVTVICGKNPDARVLIVTSLEDEDKIVSAIQVGALGYFPKTAPRPYLLEGIRKVADGIPYLPSGIAIKLFKSIRDKKAASIPSSENNLLDEPLTSRQQEILVLLVEGRSDEEIGTILHIEEATVRSHVHRIIMRLGVETRAQAVAAASQMYKKR
jgi:two-component system, NarL family, response regulator LiaR